MEYVAIIDLLSEMESVMDAPGIEFDYVQRVGQLEPRIRLTIHRKTGRGIVEICVSALEDICPPESEGSLDVLAAFRASMPTILGLLRRIIADTPAGSVTIVTRDLVRLQLAETGQEPPAPELETASPPKAPAN